MAKIDEIYTSLHKVMESKKVTNDEALMLADKIRNQAFKNIMNDLIDKAKGR
jgi:hypothetical protein